jgi:hypothetical protein
MSTLFFYRDLFRPYMFDYIKRVFVIYLLSLAVVGILLTIIQVAPWRRFCPGNQADDHCGLSFIDERRCK